MSSPMQVSYPKVLELEKEVRSLVLDFQMESAQGKSFERTNRINYTISKIERACTHIRSNYTCYEDRTSSYFGGFFPETK